MEVRLSIDRSGRGSCFWLAPAHQRPAQIVHTSSSRSSPITKLSVVASIERRQEATRQLAYTEESGSSYWIHSPLYPLLNWLLFFPCLSFSFQPPVQVPASTVFPLSFPSRLLMYIHRCCSFDRYMFDRYMYYGTIRVFWR